jgi:putative hydrolase of the HAD superfamily
MLRFILFDLDNTLIDFMSFKKKTAKAAVKALKSKGWKLSQRKTIERIFRIYAEKGIEYQKTFKDLVYGQGYGGNEAEKLQQAAILAYLREKERALKPFAGVEKTLARLGKRHVLAILSDAPRNKAWQRLIMAGLDKYFAQVGTFHDTKEYKPHRRPFLLMCRKLKARPSECLFVGDNPERDIKGAKAVGMKTAWAKYGHVLGNPRKGKADFVLRKFKDLEKAVMTLML